MNFALRSHKYGNKSVALCCGVSKVLKFQLIVFINQVSVHLKCEQKLSNQKAEGSVH